MTSLIDQISQELAGLDSTLGKELDLLFNTASDDTSLVDTSTTPDDKMQALIDTTTRSTSNKIVFKGNLNALYGDLDSSVSNIYNEVDAFWEADSITQANRQKAIQDSIANANKVEYQAPGKEYAAPVTIGSTTSTVGITVEDEIEQLQSVVDNNPELFSMYNAYNKHIAGTRITDAGFEGHESTPWGMQTQEQINQYVHTVALYDKDIKAKLNHYKEAARAFEVPMESSGWWQSIAGKAPYNTAHSMTKDDVDKYIEFKSAKQHATTFIQARDAKKAEIQKEIGLAIGFEEILSNSKNLVDREKLKQFEQLELRKKQLELSKKYPQIASQ